MQEKTFMPRLWTGDFVRISLVNFFIFVNFHELLSVQPDVFPRHVILLLPLWGVVPFP